MRAALWFRAREFMGRHSSKIALGLVVLVAVSALAGVRWEAQQREDAICGEALAMRSLVSELIDTAVGEAAATGLPLTTLDSFDALPVSVQNYLRELVTAASSDSGDGPDLAERLRTFQATRLGELPDFCT